MNKWLMILLSTAICMVLILVVRQVTLSFGVVYGLALAVSIFVGAVVVRLRT